MDRVFLQFQILFVIKPHVALFSSQAGVGINKRKRQMLSTLQLALTSKVKLSHSLIPSEAFGGSPDGSAPQKYIPGPAPELLMVLD